MSKRTLVAVYMVHITLLALLNEEKHERSGKGQRVKNLTHTD